MGDALRAHYWQECTVRTPIIGQMRGLLVTDWQPEGTFRRFRHHACRGKVIVAALHRRLVTPFGERLPASGSLFTPRPLPLPVITLDFCDPHLPCPAATHLSGNHSVTVLPADSVPAIA